MVSKVRKCRTLCQWVQHATSKTNLLCQPGRGGVLHHTRRGGRGGCCSCFSGAPYLRKRKSTAAIHEDKYGAPTCPNWTEPRYDGANQVSKSPSGILFQLWKFGSLCQCLSIWKARAGCPISFALLELPRIWPLNTSVSKILVEADNLQIGRSSA